MAGYGLLAGLGEALGDFGKIGLKQWQDDQDEARDTRKAQLKNKLEMDLMKAKYDFMKANPQYKQFFTDIRGNRIGIDSSGHEMMVHEAPQDEQQLNLRLHEAEAQYRENGGIASLLKAGREDDAAPAKAGLIEAQTKAANARAVKDSRDPQAKTKRDPSVLDPYTWQTRAMKLGGIDPTRFDPSDKDDQAGIAAGEEQLRKMGFSKGFQGGNSQPSGGLGAFSNAPGLGGGGGSGLLSVGGEDDSMQDHGPDDDDDSDYLN